MKRVTPSAQPLSSAEERWLAAWRTMDDEYRHQNLILMERQAKRHPRITKPTLRLVGGAE